MATMRQPVASGEQPFADNDELSRLIADGGERGYLTFEEIASTLEEVDVTKEQVAELHAHLVENGVDVISANLSPGLVGVYQVRLTIPADMTAGNKTLVIIQNDREANRTTIPVSAQSFPTAPSH